MSVLYMYIHIPSHASLLNLPWRSSCHTKTSSTHVRTCLAFQLSSPPPLSTTYIHMILFFSLLLFFPLILIPLEAWLILLSNWQWNMDMQQNAHIQSEEVCKSQWCVGHLGNKNNTNTYTSWGLNIHVSSIWTKGASYTTIHTCMEVYPYCMYLGKHTIWRQQSPRLDARIWKLLMKQNIYWNQS